MNPFAFGENSDFPISAHHQTILAIFYFVQHGFDPDLGDHQPFFKLLSEMVFWEYVFRPFLI